MRATRWAASLVAAVAIAGRAEAQLHPPPAREPVIVSLDPRYDRLVPPGAALERIVDGHQWTEGPLWVREGG